MSDVSSKREAAAGAASPGNGDAAPRTYFYDPAEGHGLPHDPFKALIAPRPIGWISTLDARGRGNLAPYSYANAVCDVPPLLMFSSDGWKDSVANCEATGEFVWNVATLPLASAMSVTSAPLAADEDEFDLAGLAKAPCVRVKPPRVALSPAALECRVVDIIRLKGLSDRPADQWMVFGEVVGVHVDPASLTDGLFDIAKVRTIARCGYLDQYVAACPESRFRLSRPAAFAASGSIPPPR